MPYSVDPTTHDCYTGTAVLINKLDIRDADELAYVEAALVSAKAAEWEQNPCEDGFDFEHYKKIHAFLFGEIYSWAGCVRTIDLSKKGTRFCPVNQLEPVAAAMFYRLKEKNFFCGMGQEEFIDNLVDFYQRTNELHPFREGNGRTQRVFIAQLAHHAGYWVDYTKVDPDELMIATIQAANGIDGYLYEVFTKIVSKE